MPDDPYDRYIESMRSEGLLDEGDHGAAYICDRCGLEGDAPASPTSEHIFCGGRMVPKPHATGTPVAGRVRCPNTVHSNYVTDHRRQRERGHEGDCLFGGTRTADETPPSFALTQAIMVGPPYLELCEECWGESDPIDDLFQCSACRGRHWVCIDCGHIEGECTCDPNDDSGGPDGF